MAATPHHRSRRLFRAHFLRIAPLAALIAVLAPAVAAPLAAQATRTWTGGGGDDNWTTAANWGGTAPVAGDRIVFDADGVAVRPSPNNDFTAGTSFLSITINAAGYTISGNEIQTTQFPAVVVSHSTGTVEIALPIGGNRPALMSGNGTLILSNTNGFSAILVQRGTVVAKNASALGAGAVWLGHSAYSDAATVLVGTTGLTVSNPIELTTGAPGTLAVGTLGEGNIEATFSGGVTGDNDLVISHNGGSGLLEFDTAAVNNAGTVRLVGSATGPTNVISLGSNVTLAAQASATSRLYLAAITVNTGGTTLHRENTGGSAELVVGSSVSGTGNLIFRNDSDEPSSISVGGGLGNISITGSITGTGTGTGSTFIGSNIRSSVTDLIQDGAPDLTFVMSSEHTGSLRVRAGRVIGYWSLDGPTFSSGPIVLGDASNNKDASLLLVTNNMIVANPIQLTSGTTGRLAIGILDGSVAASFTGGITGSNDLMLLNGSTGQLTISTGTVDIAGTLTNAGAGSGLVNLSAPIGSNVTEVIQNSPTSEFYAHGDRTIGASGATYTNLQSGKRLNVGKVTGTGNVTLRNQGTLTDGILVNGAGLDNVGTVTNAGTGTGRVRSIADIGSNVTGIVQAGAGELQLQGAINVNASGTTLTHSGTARMAIDGGTVGTGNLILDNAGTNPSSFQFSSDPLNHAGSIVNTGTGTNTVSLAAVLGANITGVYQESATARLNISAANGSYANGFVVRKGLLTGSANAASFGSGTITLGHTSGSDAASVLIASNISPIANPIVLASGTTGTLSVGTMSNATTSYTGGITGTNDLTIQNGGSGALTLATGSINNVGTITNASTGGGAVTISAPVSSNVTQVIHSSVGEMQLAAIEVNSAGTTLTRNSPSGSQPLTVTGAVTGTGDLTLHSVAGYTRFTSTTQAVNHTGAIINSGSGLSGNIIIANIGANVTTVLQTSSTAGLSLYGTNSFQGGVQIRKGSIFAGTASALGTGAVTLGETNGFFAASLTVSETGLTIANPIMLQSGSMGTLMVQTGNSVTAEFTGGISGTGHLVINNGTSLSTASLTFSTSAVNNAGGLVITGNATGGVFITAPIGPNVTDITLGTQYTPLTVSGLLTVASGGTSVGTASTGTKLTLSGGVAGTGDLTLRAIVNGNANALEVSDNAVNHAGRVVNAGTGNSAVQISAPLGANVTEVVQSANLSGLVLTGDNSAFSGPIAVTNGSITANASAALGDASATNTISLGGTLRALASFTSPASRVITLTGTGAKNIQTNGHDLTLAGGVTGTGDLVKQDGGILALGAASSVTGMLSISQGTLREPPTTLTVGGRFNNNSTFARNGGTVILNGATTQIIDGSSSTVFNNLTIDGAGLAITTSPVVEGALTFVNGGITTGANKFMLGANGSVSGAGPGKYVHGNLERRVPDAAAPSLDFPIGDASTYAPVSVAFSGTTTGSGAIVASTAVGDHADIANAGLNADKTANRTWTVANNGVGGFTSYDATFTFDASDLDAGVGTADFVVRKLDSGTWSNTIAGTRTATSTQATGLTSFSDFQVGEMLAVTATVASTTPATLAESTLNGASITVDITDGTFVPSLGASNFTLSDAPAGTSISAVTRESGTRAVLALAFDGTDFDAASTLAVQIEASAVVDWSTAIAAGSVAVATAPATSIVLAGPTSGTPNAVTSAITLMAIESNGSTMPVASDHAFALTSDAASGTFYADAAAATVITQATVPTGSTAATFYYRDTAAGSRALIAASDVLGADTLALTIGASGITIASDPAALTESSLNGATITVDLANATFAAVMDAVGFEISPAPAGASISGVSRVSDTRAVLTLAFDASDFDTTATLGVQVKQSALATGTAASANLSVSPTSASSVTIAGPSAGVPNAISSAITLTAAEPNGSPMVVAADRVFSLASGVATGKFYAAAAAATEITQVTLATGTGTATFYFRDSASGARILAAASDVLGSVTLEHTIASSTLAATAAAASLTEATLNGAAVTVDLTNAAFAAVIDAAGFELSPAPAGTSISAVSRASDTRAVLTIAFDATDFDTAATLSVAVRQSALAAGSASSSSLTVSPAPASNLTIAGAAAIAQQVVTPLTLTMSEPNGTTMRLAAPAELTLASSTGTGSFYMNADGSGAITTAAIPSGVASVTIYYRDDVPGSRDLTATHAELGAASHVLNVSQVLSLAFGAIPDSVPADLAMPPVLVSAVDARGEVDTTFAGEIALELTAQPGAAELSGIVVATAARGVATFSDLRLDVVGAGYTLRATAGADVAQTTSAAFNAYLPAVNVTATLTASPEQPLVGQTATITLKLDNHTDARALGVVYSVPLPERAQFVSAQPTQGTYDDATGLWTVGTLDGSGSATLVITITIKAGGSQ